LKGLQTQTKSWKRRRKEKKDRDQHNGGEISRGYVTTESETAFKGLRQTNKANKISEAKVRADQLLGKRRDTLKKREKQSVSRHQKIKNEDPAEAFSRATQGYSSDYYFLQENRLKTKLNRSLRSPIIVLGAYSRRGDQQKN